MDYLIAEEKFKYYEKEEQKIQIYNPKAIPYQILKNLAEPERPQTWNIQAMRPGVSYKDIADELAEYFSIITNTAASRSQGSA